MNNLILRPANETDTNFLLSTWLKSYYVHGNAYRKPNQSIYYKEHQDLVKKRLATSSVTVATTSEDETQIIGYIVCDADCIHYLYVKNIFRGFGIAKKLLAGNWRDSYSHHTAYSDQVNKGMQFNPYLFTK